MTHTGLSRSLDLFQPKVTTIPTASVSAQLSTPEAFLDNPIPSCSSNVGPFYSLQFMILLCQVPAGVLGSSLHSKLPR